MQSDVDSSDTMNLTSAAGIADDVRTGKRSAVAVLESFTDRFLADNPRLNAIIASRSDAARMEAVAIDVRVQAGQSVGPLAGVPFTVKDVLATSDLPTTCGSRVLDGHRTTQDATVVRRLRNAGAILVGKTNTPEFAFGIDTVNELYGRTRNPLGDFTPGGSSGGESAAVAAGMSALGVGTDFGGSVRWPAQCTGIVGLRPTVGRCPTTGLLPGINDEEPTSTNPRSVQGRLQAVGLLARSVSDVSLALQVIAGPDDTDSFAQPVPLNAPTNIHFNQLEIRYGSSLADQRIAPEVADAVEWAVDAFARKGAALAPELPRQLHQAVELFSALRRTDAFDEIRAVADHRIHDLTPMVQELLGSVPETSERELVGLWAQRDRLRYELLSWLVGSRLLLLPVASQLPYWSEDARRQSGPSQFDLLAMSRAVTLFGLPSLSVPCPPARDGRPVSIQIVGPPFREDLVLSAGRLLEDRLKETDQ
jgi:amidase